MTPTTGCRSLTQAITTVHAGMPRTKLAVPSIGSITQTEAGAAGNLGMLLADDAVVGIGLGERRAHEHLDLAVGIGDQVLVALAFDGEGVERPE